MSVLWCDCCQNMGAVDCFCGGDLCVCANYGERPCPRCGGTAGLDDDDEDLAADPELADEQACLDAFAAKCVTFTPSIARFSRSELTSLVNDMRLEPEYSGSPEMATAASVVDENDIKHDRGLTAEYELALTPFVGRVLDDQTMADLRETVSEVESRLFGEPE